MGEGLEEAFQCCDRDEMGHLAVAHMGDGEVIQWSWFGWGSWDELELGADGVVWEGLHHPSLVTSGRYIGGGYKVAVFWV